MLRWEDRPSEIANHFNPAFCSLLLSEAVSGFLQRSGRGMEYAISFLILPVVLHELTREALPRNTRTKLHAWIQNTPSCRIGFGKRVRSLKPYTQESLIFGMQRSLFTVDIEGTLITVKKKIPKLSVSEGSELNEMQERALFVGKWFADVRDTSTLLAAWGLRP